MRISTLEVRFHICDDLTLCFGASGKKADLIDRKPCRQQQKTRSRDNTGVADKEANLPTAQAHATL